MHQIFKPALRGPCFQRHWLTSGGLIRPASWLQPSQAARRPLSQAGPKCGPLAHAWAPLALPPFTYRLRMEALASAAERECSQQATADDSEERVSGLQVVAREERTRDATTELPEYHAMPEGDEYDPYDGMRSLRAYMDRVVTGEIPYKTGCAPGPLTVTEANNWPSLAGIKPVKDSQTEEVYPKERIQKWGEGLFIPTWVAANALNKMLDAKFAAMCCAQARNHAVLDMAVAGVFSQRRELVLLLQKAVWHDAKAMLFPRVGGGRQPIGSQHEGEGRPPSDMQGDSLEARSQRFQIAFAQAPPRDPESCFGSAPPTAEEYAQAAELVWGKGPASDNDQAQSERGRASVQRHLAATMPRQQLLQPEAEEPPSSDEEDEPSAARARRIAIAPRQLAAAQRCSSRGGVHASACGGKRASSRPVSAGTAARPVAAGRGASSRAGGPPAKRSKPGAGAFPSALAGAAAGGSGAAAVAAAGATAAAAAAAGEGEGGAIDLLFDRLLEGADTPAAREAGISQELCGRYLVALESQPQEVRRLQICCLSMWVQHGKWGAVAGTMKEAVKLAGRK
ncbi:hypothetical protein ABPG75_002779 [Micractinium tetrahymenae]